MYKAIDIAYFIVNDFILKGHTLTGLALQKVLYIEYLFYFAITGENIFVDDIEAWDYGPIVREVYLRYLHQGYVQLDKPDNVPKVSVSDQQLLCAFNDILLSISASDLLDFSTSVDSPWRKCYTGYSKNIIPQELLHSYALQLFHPAR